jgi:hypothetical protein
MKRKIMIGLGVIILIALLAGAAYVIPGLASGRLTNIVAAIPGFSADNHNDRTDVTLIPAPELPPHAPNWVGTVASTQDNSIFASPRNGGTQMEIVTTHDTHVWVDDLSGIQAQKQTAQSGSEGTVHVQEVVRAITVSQVVPSDDILIWGEQRGNRWFASTVLLRGMVGAKSGTPLPDQ